MKYLSFILILISYPALSQSDLNGMWETGQENSIIEIIEVNGNYTGILKSTDNDKAEIGRIMLRDLEQQGAVWSGQIFAAKRKKWLDVEITPGDNILELEIDAGIRSKSVKWKRQQT
jgi:hypothetical protein